MNVILSNCLHYSNGRFVESNLIKHNKSYHQSGINGNADDTHDFVFNNCIIFPGFVDVHTHLREPGFSYKETFLSGTAAAAKGGYTTIFTMPNLNPVPHNVENLRIQTDLIEKNALINVYPYASITVDEAGKTLSDMDELAPYVIGFSDDGRGVQNDHLMRSAMQKAKNLDKIIVAHCEDNSLLHGGYIHDGEYAKKHGHKGICSESEWRQVERDVALVEQTGCAYHICHVSTKESVDLIRKAKARGLNISCETAPHYLLLCDDDLKEDGRFKMNPPLRSSDDKKALIEGLCDGTIDMIATDHAPHSTEEKSKGLNGSAMGVVGLETAFPLLYTYLVKKNIISLEKLTELISINPRKRFRFPDTVTENMCVFDLESEYKIDSGDFLSMGKATPFDGWTVNGECKMTICGDKIVYTAKNS